jgi:hypothetical protein
VWQGETSHAGRASPECQQNGVRVKVASSLPQRSTAGRQACLTRPSSSTTTCRGIPPVVGSAFAHHQFLQVDVRSNPPGKSILRPATRQCSVVFPLRGVGSLGTCMILGGDI